MKKILLFAANLLLMLTCASVSASTDEAPDDARPNYSSSSQSAPTAATDHVEKTKTLEALQMEEKSQKGELGNEFLDKYFNEVTSLTLTVNESNRFDNLAQGVFNALKEDNLNLVIKDLHEIINFLADEPNKFPTNEACVKAVNFLLTNVINLRKNIEELKIKQQQALSKYEENTNKVSSSGGTPVTASASFGANGISSSGEILFSDNHDAETLEAISYAPIVPTETRTIEEIENPAEENADVLAIATRDATENSLSNDQLEMLVADIVKAVIKINELLPTVSPAVQKILKKSKETHQANSKRLNRILSSRNAPAPAESKPFALTRKGGSRSIVLDEDYPEVGYTKVLTDLSHLYQKEQWKKKQLSSTETAQAAPAPPAAIRKIKSYNDLDEQILQDDKMRKEADRNAIENGEQWKCSLCHQMNDIASTKCKDCHTFQPGKNQAAVNVQPQTLAKSKKLNEAKNGENWKCSLCGQTNDNTSTKCKDCSTASPK